MSGGSLDLLLDTQIIVWISISPERLSVRAQDAIDDPALDFKVSAVTAWEFADLNRRGRFGVDLALAPLLRRLAADVLDFPAAAWSLANDLPDIHRDPVGRMLIAHALHSNTALLTADEMIRRYPIKTIW